MCVNYSASDQQDYAQTLNLQTFQQRSNAVRY